MRVEVVYCPAPGVDDRVVLELPAGATLADAVRASGLRERHSPAIDGLRTGVWGRLQEPATRLREGDRVEIYRPLIVDPKEARRLRDRANPAKRVR